MIVNVTGKINPETGYVIDMGVLKKIIKDEVEEKLDHKNLNLDVDYFSNTIPSAENICIYIHKLLRKKISNDLNISVTLFETPRNFVTYPSN
jgi:6-pyruvoyltetrahydropterin/6-carboxytetrahydropterin synthase